MKKIYMILAAVLVMLAANSCDKANVSQDDLSVEPMVVKFTAQAADVKAQFNPTSYENGAAVPVLWNGGEKLSIALGDNNAKDFARDCAEVVASEDKKSAVWEYDFSGLATEEYTPAAPYTFHVFCGAARAYRTDNQSKVLLNNIPSEQAPGVNSCDPKAIYLYSKSGEYETWPSEVVMDSFEHLTAYGCITLGTGIPEEEKVQSVTITADAATNLSGATWYFYKTGNKYANYTGSTSPKSAPSITLKPAEGCDALQRKNIWFGCRPTTDLASLKFTVITDKGVYEVEKSELGERNFQAGKVAMMTINGFAPIEEGDENEEGDESIVTYDLDASEVLSLIGGAKTYNDDFENTLQYAPDSGPSLEWKSTGILASTECKLSLASGRIKFGTGAKVPQDFKITITPPQEWIIKSVVINAAIAADKEYQLTAKVGGTTLIDDALTTANKDYSAENTGLGSLEVNIANNNNDKIGVFYISKITIQLIPVSVE